MPLYKTIPPPSSRMGIARVLAGIKGLGVLEFGSMGHTIYQLKAAHTYAINLEATFYSTHINEQDIALGSTQRLTDAIQALMVNPDIFAIALLPSSIGEMIGTDLKAEANMIEDAVKPIITFKRGGFKYSFEEGMEEAYLQLVKGLCKSQTDHSHENKILILGQTSNQEALINRLIEAQLIRDADRASLCFISQSCHVTDFGSIPVAKQCIVISEVAEKAAQYLQKQFDIPYTMI